MKALNKFQEMVRARLREKTPNYSILARFLKSNPSTIHKRLNEGGPDLSVDWLDDVTSFYQMSVSEMCAMPGSLIQPVTPIEAALLALFRQMTELERRSLLTILERPIYTQSPTAKKSRLGRAMLTGKEQELVDLFARVKRDGVREGVLQTLRGAVQGEASSGPVKTRTPG